MGRVRLFMGLPSFTMDMHACHNEFLGSPAFGSGVAILLWQCHGQNQLHDLQRSRHVVCHAEALCLVRKE